MLSSRFTSVTLENFRGVRGRQTFDLDAPVVLLWGPNGTGKTTVFDGLLWLLQGSLPRLKAHALRRNDEYIVSAYGASRPARVQARVRAGSSVFDVERTGTSAYSTLSLRYPVGNELTNADAYRELRARLSRGTLPLEEILATSGLLQQEDLRQMLRDKPDARFRQLLRLLGLESLELFERFVDSDLKSARATVSSAKLRFEQCRSRATETRDRIETVETLSAISLQETTEIESLRISLDSESRAIRPRSHVKSLRDIEDLVADVEIARSASTGALEAIRGMPAARTELEGNLDVLGAECDAAEERYRESQLLLDAAKEARDRASAKHDEVVALIALAIQLLEAHSESGVADCPVCETRIDVKSTIERLVRRGESSAELADADTAVEEAREAWVVARRELNAARQAREGFLERLRADQLLAGRIDDLGRSLAALLGVKSFEVVGLARETPSELVARVFRPGESRQELVSILANLERRLAELSPIASSARHRIAVREDSLHRRGQVPQLRAALEVIESEVKAAASAHDAARRELTATEGLRVAAAAAVASIFERRFEAIDPLMNDIYSRLDPHPTFTKLDFAIERYRGRGTAMASVTDEDNDVQANPLLVFSAAQANVVVLSAFLALGWAAGRNGLPFVLMDDPLQSLDDVNVLGFSDLVGQLRAQKQVMLSTHEERFARLLERKLTMSPTEGPTIVHRFLGWSREGPQVETRRVGFSEPVVVAS